MGGISNDAVRERAYQIWEREGRPHGRDFEHWVRAQVELTVEARSNSNNPKKSAAPTRSRSTAARATPAKASKPAAARKPRR
jgi:hypothetical protein